MSDPQQVEEVPLAVAEEVTPEVPPKTAEPNEEAPLLPASPSAEEEETAEAPLPTAEADVVSPVEDGTAAGAEAVEGDPAEEGSQPAGPRRVGTIVLYVGQPGERLLEVPPVHVEALVAADRARAKAAAPQRAGKEQEESLKKKEAKSPRSSEEREERAENAEMSAPPSKEEVRDVYVDAAKYDGAPYYLCESGNPILVVDPDRIQFYPGMVEPPEQTYTMRQIMAEAAEKKRLREAKARAKEEAARQAAAQADDLDDEIEEEDPKNPLWKDDVFLIGSIVVPLSEVQGYEGVPGLHGVQTEEREVYCSRKSRYEPYYFTKTFNRVMVVDPGRIRFVPSALDTCREKKDQLRKREDRAEEIKAKKAAIDLVEAERAKMATIGVDVTDIKVGSIVVQKALQPGERLTAGKQVCAVYCKEEEVGALEEMAKRAQESSQRKLTPQTGRTTEEAGVGKAALGDQAAVEDDESLDVVPVPVVKPYLLSETGKRIYVKDFRSIRFLKRDKQLPPPSSQPGSKVSRVV